MNGIDYDNISRVFSELPHDEHDVSLYENYLKKFQSSPWDLESVRSAAEFPQSLLELLPVYENSLGPDDAPSLTRYGFMKLCLDRTYMNSFYIPLCMALINRGISDAFLYGKKLQHLRLNLIEFALLANLEPQNLLFKLEDKFGFGDAVIEQIVMRRWPNFQDLQRFLIAHEGHGIGVNADDVVSSYDQALSEVNRGCKATGWIWYIFPQMSGIKGVHSRPAIKYGIHGRMEAFQYINHPVLRAHLTEIVGAVLDNSNSVYEIFGDDTMKVRSCMKLFNSVSDIPELKALCRKYNWS